MKNLYATGQQVFPLVFSTNDHLWEHTNGFEKSSPKTATCMDYGHEEVCGSEQGPKLKILNFVPFFYHQAKQLFQ